ncbi:helix-turn-helix domain-containing protein [Deinococcus yunweiensis]|uniref:helix-turn-helix domain-containing protein n=1 Tax=Deinococcus yunweiensis TaxID=367282 RepID=UPI00398EBFE2
MSAHATVWAWNQKAGRAKATLIALANFADAAGVCRVPQTHLAAMTEGSIKTVQRHLQHLEDTGLIAREKHWDDDGRQELDEIQLCGFTAGRSFGKRRGSGGDILTPYREQPGDILTPIEQDPYSLLNSSFPTTNSMDAPAGLPDQTEPAPVAAVGEKRVETSPVPSSNDHAPDGAAPGGAQTSTPSPNHSENAPSDGETKNVTGEQNVPPAAPATYRAAMDAISGAGLLPVWRDWVRLNKLAQVSQEAQALVWGRWISEGKAETLRAQATDLIASGSFSHPWGALRKRMSAQALPPVSMTSGPLERPSLRVGQRVRYPDGTEATVLAILSRGVATDHPEYPDVPLGQVRTLEVLS